MMCASVCVTEGSGGVSRHEQLVRHFIARSFTVLASLRCAVVWMRKDEAMPLVDVNMFSSVP